MKFAALVFAVLLAGCSLAINVPPTPTSRLPQLTPTPALVEPTATTSPPPPKPLITAPAVAPTATTQPALLQSLPLKAKDAPAGGAQQLVSYFASAGTPRMCSLKAPGSDDEHRADAAQCVIEITDELFLNFDGFGPGDADVSVQLPDGNIELDHVSLQDRPFVWTSLPGEPLGMYQVTATQGSKRLVGGFTVRAASSPGLVVFPREVMPGSSVEVGLAGMQPGQQVRLSLYRHYGQVLNVSSGQVMHDYAAALGSATIDDRGQALFSFSTARDDPWGDYLVVSDPPVDPLNQGSFTLGARSNEFLLHDTPPPGLPAELPFKLVDTPCVGQQSIEPSSRPLQGTVEPAMSVALCFQGLRPQTRYQVTQTAPDQSTDRPGFATDRSGAGKLLIALSPFAPMGTYRVTFGETPRVVATFALQPATQPRVAVDSISGYSPQHLVLAGFAPNTRVPVHFYRHETCGSGSTCWRYSSSIPAIMVDDKGRLLYRLPPVPKNDYLIAVSVAGGMLQSSFTVSE